jgi:hypothetical protein
MGLPRLDFLKIDVEGMEMEVLAGAKGMIARHRPWCWVEYWMVGAETIAGAFAGLGYECYRVDELNLLCAPAERLAASGLTFEATKVPS